jgi:hypothetical protein
MSRFFEPRNSKSPIKSMVSSFFPIENPGVFFLKKNVDRPVEKAFNWLSVLDWKRKVKNLLIRNKKKTYENEIT